ncbi:putative O-linked N-acetylglucosamine transferase, SPINDLY family [Piscirickettsia salmonis]|uniref:hypothetical protein n=1 Tax=Piscirickettsia salmonis TaxID=1238 RepID=UPI0012BAAF57|nr:hypothetical protein [Piscirickettsia salmonis]QGP55136.1 putative O-linked N-acetylglucosamine transferase, SPINDLY family [Piscirickettsia salmonis]QGP59005.1 putative O-linked N-acetylglucosamine transferase, SPINDLY family [Piscirickettsia salmonis]QGP64701.1 putative O-linked N-acetylglucosamine transferase, SPINDLY family [Piscirickettsia salmonis]
MSAIDNSQQLSKYHQKVAELVSQHQQGLNLEKITNIINKIYTLSTHHHGQQTQLSHYNQLISFLQQALAKKNSKTLHQALLHCYITFDQISSGITFYQSLKAGFDKHLILAKLFKKQNQETQHYIYHLEKAFFFNIHDDALLTLIAETYSKNKQHLELLSFYNKLLERTPHSAKLYSLRSGVLMNLNTYNPARESATQAIRLGAANNLATASHTLTNALLSGVNINEITRLLKETKKQNYSNHVITHSSIINSPSTFFCQEQHIKSVLLKLDKNQPYKNIIINNIYPQILDHNINIEKKMSETLNAIHQNKYKINLEKAIQEQRIACLPRPSFFMEYYNLNEVKLKNFREAFSTLYQQERERPPHMHSKNIIIFCDRALPLFLKHFKNLLNTWSYDKDLYIAINPAFKGLFKTNINNNHCQPLYINEKHIIADIKKLKPDLIFYFEIGTSPLNYILPYLRLSHTQATGLGIPLSTGQPSIDYMLQQSTLLQEAKVSHLYSEKIIFSKNIILQKPDLKLTLEPIGLPCGNIYMFHHYHFKIHPDMDEVIKNIILLDPDSRIIIGYMPTYATVQSMQQRLLHSLGHQLYKQHIYIMKGQSMEQLLAITKKADVALDTFYFGMGTTALECIYSNLPIITYPSLSKTHISRVVQEIYIKLGSQLIKDYCIANSNNDYINKAIQIATNKDLNIKVKNEIKLNLHKINQDKIKNKDRSIEDIIYSISEKN